jgi:uncharacterized protein YdeI (YjbR/CyaY-like superfamily)
MAGKLDALERVEVAGRAAWRAWLRRNHSRPAGIWLVTYKKHVADKYLSYDAIVEEALCFGWIDSLPRKLDADRTMHYLSPRKARSVWSAANKVRVDQLIATKRMTAAGLKKIEAAKADGSWAAIDAVEAMEVPADLAKALKARPKARAHFDAWPRHARKQMLQHLHNARTPATRSKRLAEIVAMAERNMRRTGSGPA